MEKVKPSLSAGRVQSVAVKLIVEREREINAFREQRYFKITGTFETTEKAELKAEVSERFETPELTVQFLEACKQSVFKVSDIETKPSIRKPAPPFTTSTLQQEASRKLGFSVSQTMAVAQKLYEHGWITYMRTDSVNLSDLAIRSAKAVICQTLGERYSHSRKYTTHSKGAQEAHEAIRPTYMDKPHIEGDHNEQSLYELIYKRTIASQMADAELEKTNITIEASESKIPFVASGKSSYSTVFYVFTGSPMTMNTMTKNRHSYLRLTKVTNSAGNKLSLRNNIHYIRPVTRKPAL